MAAIAMSAARNSAQETRTGFTTRVLKGKRITYVKLKLRGCFESESCQKQTAASTRLSKSCCGVRESCKSTNESSSSSTRERCGRSSARHRAAPPTQGRPLRRTNRCDPRVLVRRPHLLCESRARPKALVRAGERPGRRGRRCTETLRGGGAGGEGRRPRRVEADAARGARVNCSVGPTCKARGPRQ